MNGRLFKVMALAVITMLITSLGFFAPASADPVLCNTNQTGSIIAPLTPEQCAQGWYREYHSYVDANGTLVQGTLDWQFTLSGLRAIMHNDFAEGSRIAASVDLDVYDGSMAGSDLVVFAPVPHDGKRHIWIVRAVHSNMLIYGDNPPANKWWGVGGTFTAGSSPSQFSAVFVATATSAIKTCSAQGLIAKHVQKRLKPRHWRCMPPPPACKKAVALKQAGKTNPARKMTRRCAVTLRRWRR